MEKVNTFYALPSALFTFLLMVTLGGACKDPVNPYTGAWEIEFNGTCAGRQKVIINDDGSFAFVVNCDGPIYNVNGHVDLETGAMSGSVKWGPLGCSNALSGHVNSSGTGSGTFECLVVMTGGWIATKL